MERVVNLHIEHLPEGVYLATSNDVTGPVAQGRTITETLEIARDVAKKLIEESGGPSPHHSGARDAIAANAAETQASINAMICAGNVKSVRC